MRIRLIGADASMDSEEFSEKLENAKIELKKAGYSQFIVTSELNYDSCYYESDIPSVEVFLEGKK